MILTYTGFDTQVFWWEIQLRFPSSGIPEGTEKKTVMSKIMILVNRELMNFMDRFHAQPLK